MTDLSKFKVAKAFQHLDPNRGLAEGITSGFSSIRYKGKILALNHGGKLYPFKREDDGSPLTFIDLVILGVNSAKSRVYFGEWNEDNASGPICASLKGDVPDPGVSIKQAKACGICPRSEWVTRPDGKRKPDCQEHKRVAVLLMPAMTKKMLGAPLLEPVFFKVPPGSFKPWKKFSDELQHEGIPFASVVTRVSFALDRQFEFNFDVVQALTDAEGPRVLKLMDSPQTRAITGEMSEVHEIAPPAKPERIETGLMEAFGGNGAAETAESAETAKSAEPAKRSRGRPAGVANKPKPGPIIDNEPTPAPQQAAAPQATGEAGDEDWDESDTDLDATVAKLMGDKMSKMMPNK